MIAAHMTTHAVYVIITSITTSKHFMKQVTCVEETTVKDLLQVALHSGARQPLP
jgi:hypothetical protein